MLPRRFDDAAEMEATSRKIHVKSVDPREAAEKCAYRNSKGELYFPGAAIARLLRKSGGAGGSMVPRKSLKFVVPAAVLVLETRSSCQDSEGSALS